MAVEPQQVLDALSSPVRREILWLVWDQELAAGDIAAAFEVTAPTISQHLTVLREAGLVTQRVDGTFRRYRAEQGAFRGLEALLAWSGRPRPTPHPDEGGAGHTETVVVLAVEVPHPPAATFACFAEPERYARWIGAPVTLDQGRFACDTERGTRVRGIYEVVAPPHLIAMQWAFEDGEVPLPGGLRSAYLRVTPVDGGSRVTIEQFVDDGADADRLRDLWLTVLTRFRTHVGAAVDDR